MYNNMRACLVIFLLALPLTGLLADEYKDTIKVFKMAGESGDFFKNSYGYAVFPTIGKGGFGVGGAYGEGRVYAKGKHVGDTSMTQITVGLQLGGQAYSQIIFFEDKRAFNEFDGKHGHALAVLAPGFSVVFTVAKGGLMYEASIGGQKFSYTPK